MAGISVERRGGVGAVGSVDAVDSVGGNDSQAGQMAARAIQALIEQMMSFDKNQDNKLDLDELTSALKSFGNGKAADTTGAAAGRTEGGRASGGCGAAPTGDGGGEPGVGDVNKDGKVDYLDLLALLTGAGMEQLPPAGAATDAGAGAGAGAGAAPPVGAGAAATPAVAGGAATAPAGAGNTSNGAAGVGGAPSAGASGPAGGGLDGLPTVRDFQVKEPGDPALKDIKQSDGKLQFKQRVDDSFLPEATRAGMKQSVNENFDKMAFFKDNFANKDQAYQFLVNQANLESAGGKVTANSSDAQGTGGGSFGYLHLHDKFGLDAKGWGGKGQNTEGWSLQQVKDDPAKYTTLSMRAMDNAYGESAAKGSTDAAAETMSRWWLGKPSVEAGSYYLSSVLNGTGVNSNTGKEFV